MEGVIVDGPSWKTLSIQQALSSLKCTSTHLPPVDSLITIIHKCRAFKNLTLAHSLHAHMHHHGLDSHPPVGNFLVPMLVECGGISHALQTFSRLVHRCEHAWTSLIQGFVNYGDCKHAFSLFEEMQADRIHASPFTFQALLKGCAQLKWLEKGLQVHAHILMAGLDVDLFVGNTLIYMYAKCGSFREAWEVFYMLPGRDVVSWNAVISGCIEHMLCEEALTYSKDMRLEGLRPNSVTFLCMLQACGILEALERGQEVHAEIVAEGLESESFIGNALVDMYAKCGSLLESFELFCELKNRDVESWNTLITAYSEQGLEEEALGCLEQMQLEDISSNDITFLCSLKVCGDAGLLEQGRKLHGDVVKGGFEINPCLGNTLVDMYAKCGSLVEAQEVFDCLLVRDLVSWNALLAGYARKGEFDTLLSIIQDMMHEGLQPDSITFLSVLSVCNHTGLVHYAQEFLKFMVNCHGIIPIARHYSSIIDLFGRSGQLDEGLTVMAQLPSHSSSTVWQARCDAYKGRCGLQISMYTPSSIRAYKRLFDNYGDAYMRDGVENYLEFSDQEEKSFHKGMWD